MATSVSQSESCDEEEKNEDPQAATGNKRRTSGIEDRVRQVAQVGGENRYSKIAGCKLLAAHRCPDARESRSGKEKL